MIEPTKIIALLQVLVTQLAQSMSQAPTEPLREDDRGRTENLKNQMDRLKGVLKKHQDHESRKRQLEKQNRDNARSG